MMRARGSRAMLFSIFGVCAALTPGPAWGGDLVWAHPDQDAGSTDDEAAIVSALMANGVTDVQTVDQLPSDISQFDRVWVLLGTYSDGVTVTQHVMTQEEGQTLADYLTESNGHLYLSGADHFAFDPATPLAPLDGVNGTSFGGPDVTDLAGQDSGVGLDLSGVAAAYTGETMFNDHIEPDLPGAGLIWMDTVTGDPLGVYHDGASSGLGNFRVIATSFEFGGFGTATDQNALMALYLSVLTGGGCPITEPIGLSCLENAGNVDLTWSNDGNTYDSVEVIRGGTVIATLGGSTESFTDMGVAAGAYTYQVQGVDTAAMCAALSEACTVIFGITDLVWAHPDQDAGATDDESAILNALVANGIAADSIDALPGDVSAFDRVWVLLGTYAGAMVTTKHVMTQEEGQTLADYLQLANGRLYLSGADHFAFDPVTPLASLDGVTGLADGEGDLSNLAGSDSGTGLDLTGLQGAYTGENALIDHIAPDPANAGAGLIWSDTVTADPLGVFHDGSLSGLGDYRVISTSFEFGGFGDAAARNLVMTRYLGVLGGPPPGRDLFKRGDADGDDQLTLLDALFGLTYLFLQGPAPLCFDTADANDDGSLDITDAIDLLAFLFLSGPPPDPPHPDCGVDPTVDALDCGSYPPCG